MDQTSALDIAERFARALDAEDYDTAARLLSDECEYTCRGQVYRGPLAIVDSYRSNGDAGNHAFEKIEYESAVVGLSERTARIQFRDHLSHQQLQCTFACEQVVEVGDQGQIVRIEHIDLPGQREALSEFIQRAGVTFG